MSKQQPPVQDGSDIIQTALEDVMHQSMMPYAEYVILERALPRVEDGLKPVQRRILFTMQELGLSPDKPHRKCARIVGDCLGKYHPHGDTSVYDALTRMAQPYSLRGVMVDGHGNFGSIDGDSAAAMRYTEARMAPLAMQMLRDIEKDTVPFHLNFDDTLKEPDILPARFPNLLVNGASGIAVGLATNIPPHNLKETIAAVNMQIDNPDVTLDELMTVLPAPDFPTGGVLLNTPEIRTAYETGRAKLTLRARVSIEQGSAGRTLLVITEVPYQVPKAQMLEKILKLSEEKKAVLGCIHDIRDESDRTGLRAVIELKKDADSQRVLAYLYKYSDLQVTFGVNLVAIADGKPMQMGLKTVISYFIKHQKNVITRRTQYELEQAKARAHILEGLIKAVDCLDEVIALIRASKNGKEAKERLIARFDFSDIQAQAILDLRLQRLTGLEILALKKEYEELQALINRLEGILKSEKKLLAVIKKELSEIGEEYGDERRTTIIAPDQQKLPVIQAEVPVPEEAVVFLTRGGQLRRMHPRFYEKLDMPTQPEDKPRYIFRTQTDHTLYFFTDKGNCFPVSVGALAEANRPKDRGVMLSGVLAGLEHGENCVYVLLAPPESLNSMEDLLFVTKEGMVKRTAAAEYDVKRTKFAAITLKGSDTLFTVLPVTEGDILFMTKRGMGIRFTQDSVPATGRASSGVKGIKLDEGDEVICASMLQNNDQLVLFSERGYAKRVMGSLLDVQGRYGKGMKVMGFNKNGNTGTYLAAAACLHASVTFSVLQANGVMTPLNCDELALQDSADKGKPCVMALMDDVVTDIIL